MATETSTAKIDELIDGALRDLTAAAAARRDSETETRQLAAAADAALAEQMNAAGAHITETLAAKLTPLREELADVSARSRGAEEAAGELAVRIEALTAQVASLSEQTTLPAPNDEITDVLREELAEAVARLEKRIKRVKRKKSSAQPDLELASRVEHLEEVLDEQHDLSVEQARAIEHAVKRGFADLGRKVAGTTGEYLVATESLRRSLDALEAATTSSEKSFASEGGKKGSKKRRNGSEDAAFGHVAFMPTPEGYRLVERPGEAPEAGAVVETEAAGALTVTRVSRSPLPFDERQCVFLERP